MTSSTISDLATNPPVDHGTLWYVLTSVTHVVSGAAIVGALVGVLPALSALGALVWYALQIYETKTVQSWLNRKKPRRRTTRARSKASSPRKRV